METNPIEVGRRIRRIRKNQLGLSMANFGKKIGDIEGTSKIQSGTVSNWETGKNLPNNERLKIIADIGNISVDELLHGTVDEIIIKGIESQYDNSKNILMDVNSKEIIKRIKEDISVNSHKYESIDDIYKLAQMFVQLSVLKDSDSDEIVLSSVIDSLKSINSFLENSYYNVTNRELKGLSFNYETLTFENNIFTHRAFKNEMNMSLFNATTSVINKALVEMNALYSEKFGYENDKSQFEIRLIKSILNNLISNEFDDLPKELKNSNNHEIIENYILSNAKNILFKGLGISDRSELLATLEKHQKYNFIVDSDEIMKIINGEKPLIVSYLDKKDLKIKEMKY